MLKLAALVSALLLVTPTFGDEGWDDNDDFEDLDYADEDAAGSYEPPGGVSSYSAEDPAADHRAEAIRRDGLGDNVGAIESFAAACKFNPTDASGFMNLGVANMRAALKGLDVSKHLTASRSAFELAGGLGEGIDSDNQLKENIKALEMAENWAKEQSLVEGQGEEAEDAGMSVGDAANAAQEASAGVGGAGAVQLQKMIDTAVAKALGPVVEDVEMLESSFEAQLKAALYRIKQLEAKLGTAGEPASSLGKAAAPEEDVDERDEL